MSRRVICSECVNKQDEIDRLRAENQNLKAKINYQDRKITEGYFGSSTPSSQIPHKAKSSPENKRKKRGAKKGHKGNGREKISKENADKTVELEAPDVCPDCGEKTQGMGARERSVIDLEPVEIITISYRVNRNKCPHCNKVVQARIPGVLPKCLYSNKLLAHVAIEHYVNGLSFGYLEEQTGVGASSIVDAMHHLSRLFKDVPGKLIEKYRQSQLKQADETSWRTYGKNGYAWLFCTPSISVYRFRQSRAGKIAQDVLGTDSLSGVLVVDRYAGYNKSPCKIQYCYAHLLRKVQDLEKEFPGNSEIKLFVQTVAPLLSDAMSLRSMSINDKEFYSLANQVKNKLINTMNQQANHPGIQKTQNLFREHKERLYHWVDDRNIPADNNRSERELRPLVIARKISFGSQSLAGDKTRETLMTTLISLKKQNPNADLITILTDCLNKIALNNNIDSASILFNDSS